MATAKQVDFLLAGYRHPTTNRPLAGGKVETFLDGTSSTLSALWTDSNKVGVATNPIILDSAGKAEVYGDNIYRFRVYESDDTFIEEITGLEYESVLKTKNEVETIADLRLVSGAVANETVTVLGYDDVGDGGGGPPRYWSEGQPPGTYVDNGGSIIVPTGGDGSAAWLITEFDNIDPAWWGADLTGTIDSTSAFNKAIAHIGNGGTIRASYGTYLLGSLDVITKPIILDFSGSKILPNTTGIMFEISITDPNVVPDSVYIKNGNVYPGPFNPSSIVRNNLSFNTTIANFNVQNIAVTATVFFNVIGFGFNITHCKIRGCSGPFCIYYSFAVDGLTTWTTSSNIDNVDISSFGNGIGVFMEGGLPVAISDSTFQYIPNGAISHSNQQNIQVDLNNVYFEGNDAYDFNMGDGTGGGLFKFDNVFFGPTPGHPNRVRMDDSSTVTAINCRFAADVGGFYGEVPISFTGINNTAQGPAIGYTGTYDRELADSIRGGCRKNIINKKTDLTETTVGAALNDALVLSQPLTGSAYDEWLITSSNNYNTGIVDIFRVFVNRNGASGIVGTVVSDKQEAEILTLNVAPVTPWAVGDIITGNVSGVSCEIVSITSTLIYRVKNRNGNYSSGEILSNGVVSADQGPGYPTTTTASGISYSSIGVIDGGDNTYSIRAYNFGPISMSYRTTFINNHRLF